MSRLTRRNFLATGAALPLLGACNTGFGNGGGGTRDTGARIDQRVDAAIDLMYDEVPGTRQLAENATGMLVMPLVTEAGFGFGGSFGQGALRRNGISLGYYNAVGGSFGLQIGAQQYSHTLFFMTDDAFNTFRDSTGWEIGADVRYALNTTGATLGVDTTTLLDPVIAVIFGRAGLIAGATLDGLRYIRLNA
jgi:lipid-binding SYLF domain-containing protein